MAADLINDGSDVKFARLLFNKGTDDALSFNCLIKDIEQEYINFVATSDYTDQVQAGAPLEVRIYSQSGIVKAEATLLKTYKQNSTLCYTTTYPTPFEHTQKREYYRADIHIPVKLLILLQNGQVKNIEATTKNISGRGMCFVSVEPEIPNYHSITINFTLNGRFFVVTGDYVHSTPVKYKNATLYIHAFKFISIEAEDINFIVKECFLHQLRQKKVT